MTVRELIKELSQIPDDYEVLVTLSELPGPDATKEEEMRCTESIVAESAFICSANAYDKEKMAFIFGCALPKPEDDNCRFDLYRSDLTIFQRRKIEAWLEDAFEDGVNHPLSKGDALVVMAIAHDELRWDPVKRLLFDKGSPGYVALEGKYRENN